MLRTGAARAVQPPAGRIQALAAAGSLLNLSGKRRRVEPTADVEMEHPDDADDETDAARYLSEMDGEEEEEEEGEESEDEEDDDEGEEGDGDESEEGEEGEEGGLPKSWALFA